MHEVAYEVDAHGDGTRAIKGGAERSIGRAIIFVYLAKRRPVLGLRYGVQRGDHQHGIYPNTQEMPVVCCRSPGRLTSINTVIGGSGLAMKIVVIGRWILIGDSDKEVVRQYVTGTLESMAEFDGVTLPYKFKEKLNALIDSVPPDEFEGCLDDVEQDI